MPDFTDGDIIEVSSSAWSTPYFYDEYSQTLITQDRQIERMWQEEEELREDKRKYPLFFWKDGIV